MKNEIFSTSCESFEVKIDVNCWKITFSNPFLSENLKTILLIFNTETLSEIYYSKTSELRSRERTYNDIPETCLQYPTLSFYYEITTMKSIR